MRPCSRAGKVQSAATPPLAKRSGWTKPVGWAGQSKAGVTLVANVYVEARPKGRPEGSPITDYVVESSADAVLGTFPTQAAAIAWAKQQGHSPLVARVRHLNDKKKPDHRRAA